MVLLHQSHAWPCIRLSLNSVYWCTVHVAACCAWCSAAAFAAYWIAALQELQVLLIQDIKGKLTNACGLGGLFKHHSRLL